MKDAFKQLITDSVERTYKNIHQRDIKFTLYDGKANCLIGVRRCGKTSLMQSTIVQLRLKVRPENTVYINLEDDRLFPLQLNNLNELIEAYYELYPKKRTEKVYFFIDEIQVVEGWEKFIRRLLDTENCCVVLSGSSAKLLSKEIHTSLRGRSISTEVQPLSFKEYLRFKNIDSENMGTRNQSFIKHALTEYLAKGGFPELVDIPIDESRKFLQEYKDLIIYRDLVERYNIRELFPLRYLINHVFRNMGTLFSVNKMNNDLKSQGIRIGKSTLYDYVAKLRDCFAIQTVPIFSKSIKEQNRNPQKIYSVDNGFALTVTSGIDYSKCYENIAYVHLRKKYGEELFYWKGNQEVDFYAPKDKALINVSYELTNKQTYEREVNGLTEAMRTLKLKRATLVTNSKSETLKIDGLEISIIPLWKWLLED
jgi:uncharacterized protein